MLTNFRSFISLQNTDFASSVLCGYLRIQNLTQEYPELTTYFHAEIIGSRYGFVTSDEWGASEKDDMTHWSRFPAFRSVRNQLKRPGLTMRDRGRKTIFMRWKERFLVPDHKTTEISGARLVSFFISIARPLRYLLRLVRCLLMLSSTLICHASFTSCHLLCCSSDPTMAMTRMQLRGLLLRCSHRSNG